MLELVDLRKTWLFEGLSEDEMELVSDLVEYRRCPPETVIVEANTTDRRLFIVHSGSVRIVRRDGTGESPIAEVLPGQHFGEVCFIDGGARTATAISNETTELLVLEPARIDQIAQAAPRAAYTILWSMLRLLCGRLRTTDYWLFELMGKEARK